MKRLMLVSDFDEIADDIQARLQGEGVATTGFRLLDVYVDRDLRKLCLQFELDTDIVGVPEHHRDSGPVRINSYTIQQMKEKSDLDNVCTN